MFKILRYSRLINCDDVTAYLGLLAARQHRGFPNMVRDDCRARRGVSTQRNGGARIPPLGMTVAGIPGLG